MSRIITTARTAFLGKHWSFMRARLAWGCVVRQKYDDTIESSDPFKSVSSNIETNADEQSFAKQYVSDEILGANTIAMKRFDEEKRPQDEMTSLDSTMAQEVIQSYLNESEYASNESNPINWIQAKQQEDSTTSKAETAEADAISDEKIYQTILELSMNLSKLPEGLTKDDFMHAKTDDRIYEAILALRSDIHQVPIIIKNYFEEVNSAKNQKAPTVISAQPKDSPKKMQTKLGQENTRKMTTSKHSSDKGDKKSMEKQKEEADSYKAFPIIEITKTEQPTQEPSAELEDDSPATTNQKIEESTESITNELNENAFSNNMEPSRLDLSQDATRQLMRCVLLQALEKLDTNDGTIIAKVVMSKPDDNETLS